MHRIVLNNEVITIICDELRQLGGENERDLLALALTCKTISENALAAAWHTQFSLHRLLRLLSEDYLSISENDSSGQSCYEMVSAKVKFEEP